MSLPVSTRAFFTMPRGTTKSLVAAGVWQTGLQTEQNQRHSKNDEQCRVGVSAVPTYFPKNIRFQHLLQGFIVTS